MRRVGLIVLLAAGTAAAQPAETPATKLFEEGRDLAKQGKYPEACDKFAKSYELDDGVGTELNLADCQEHLGHLAAAWRMFDDGATRSADNPTRQKFARDRADGLAGKLATVVVKLAEPGNATVTIAGRAEKPTAEVHDRVDPGSIEVRVTKPLHADYVATQTAAAGATVTFDVAFAAPPEPVAPTSERRHTNVIASYTLGGLGVASIAGGILIGLVAKSHYNDQIANGHCVKMGGGPTCDATGFSNDKSAETLANVGTVVGGAGLAMIVAGAIVFFTAPRDVVVSPIATSQSAGVALSMSF